MMLEQERENFSHKIFSSGGHGSLGNDVARAAALSIPVDARASG
jgi:hypothetical protein